MQEFRLSFVITALALGVATWWGYTHGGVPGAMQALLIASILAIMEVSLSFDNAVVNASVLKDWSPFWQKLFLTVGMLVAVFGMRLLFPLLIVAIATNLDLISVWHMAVEQPAEYSRHLTDKHAEVAAFGGAFLLLVFLNFLFDEEKEMHWMPWFEEKMGAHGSEGLAILLTMVAVIGCVSLIPEARKYAVLYSGIVGIGVYVGVNYLSGLLEKSNQHEDTGTSVGQVVLRGSIGGFIYLEVLDASFSFDGVIGAFAITNDIVIIMLGLTIGAMFVRSMTIFLVHRGTLEEFVYLEHGAHYAIGILAIIMFASVKFHIPEWFTGLSGVAFIGLSLWSSVLYKRRVTHQA